MAETASTTDLDRLAINTIKTLAIDAVEKANSGHPGLPMGTADYAYLLWTRFLRFDPDHPDWPDRDRFVLSAGHGSMLLYALLHLSGYQLSLDEIRNFRQWGSMTPGHPEFGHAPGVETTTGPLGQGVGNSVGMAIAARMLAARFNTPDRQLVTHRVWAIVSDGDMMEGVASEAASSAGHLGLGNLTLIYDDNRITIEGETGLAFTEDVGRRFESYGFRVWRIDGHDHAQILAAFDEASEETERPGFIVARTHIGHGSPGKHDSADAHGSPLGPEETRATKKNIGWPLEPTFYIPPEVKDHFARQVARGRQAREAWQKRFDAWSSSEPEHRTLWDRYLSRSVPGDLFDRLAESLPRPPRPEATRSLAGTVLQKAAELVPSLCGGSADLEPSTKTAIKGSDSIGRGSFGGRNFHFGVREHGMGAILNGMSVHEGLIPYGATFLVFSDYMRPSIRLAALMKRQVVFVFTHDSVFMGEDGPTHQPVEHLAALRVLPNLAVVRPADWLETAMAWTVALERRDGPTALILSRQNLPPLERSEGFKKEDLFRGGYLLSERKGTGGGGHAGPPGVVALVASGSEVAPAVEAQAILAEKGVASRVISMPCPEVFLSQPAEYREGVLPRDTHRVVVEAARLNGWERVVGTDALMIGIDRFGASAPAKVLADQFGFTGSRIAERVLRHFGSA